MCMKSNAVYTNTDCKFSANSNFFLLAIQYMLCVQRQKGTNSRPFLVSSLWQVRNLFYDSVPLHIWFASPQAVLYFQPFWVSA